RISAPQSIMSDPRFARLRSDPRFRKPRKDKSKVVVDDRFKSVFAPKATKSRVDKYGRRVSKKEQQEDLHRFYQLEKEEAGPSAPDYARGEALLESSDEEEDEEEEEEEDSDSAGHTSALPINLTKDSLEVDLDEDNFEDLDAQAAEYSKSHPQESASEGKRSHRLAVVNLDWDHVRASHLFKICSSLVSPSVRKTSGQSAAPLVVGRVLSVRVFPSEFGKERLAREEKEGPPPEIFKKTSVDEEEEVNERTIFQVGDENQYDDDALRKYQLERLRYYYAIITCDTPETAAHIYSELEGTELERSANVFDLSYVPDEMDFDAECRDEATEDHSSTYKGVDFVTDALRHSKVKLTWDDDDPERNKITRRNLTKQEIEDGDFRAYLASSDEDSDAEKDMGRDKLRSLLLSGDGGDLPEGWDRGEDDDRGDVDMEITFTPGLTNTADKDETTLEKYQRKMREKRKQRKSNKEQGPAEAEAETDDFFDAGDGDTVEKSVPVREISTADELSLLVSSDNKTDDPRHFDMQAIIKAEKLAKRKGGKKIKKKQGNEDANEMQEDFKINVEDPRFKGLHDDHAFAIDPSNPQFKKTQGMTALLDARSKRRNQREEPAAAKPKNDSSRSLQNLVESVKRKSTSVTKGDGKRRRLQ
ncbi:unnamed protein product, partial [Mycena citricolor]